MADEQLRGSLGDDTSRRITHGRWQSRATVEDSVGRVREVVVTSENGRIAVSPPPGEGFSLDPDEADLLAIAIQAASNRAWRDRFRTERRGSI